MKNHVFFFFLFLLLVGCAMVLSRAPLRYVFWHFSSWEKIQATVVDVKTFQTPTCGSFGNNRRQTGTGFSYMIRYTAPESGVAVVKNIGYPDLSFDIVLCSGLNLTVDDRIDILTSSGEPAVLADWRMYKWGVYKDFIYAGICLILAFLSLGTAVSFWRERDK